MSTTLKLHLAGELAGSELLGAAVANVYAYGPRGARQPSLDQRNLVIPAGPTERLEVEVQAGRYVVEANLPSGEITSEDVRIKEGETRVVELRGKESPHEWLGWQQMLGNVPAADREPAVPSSPPRRRSSAVGRRDMLLLDRGTFDLAIDDVAFESGADLGDTGLGGGGEGGGGGGSAAGMAHAAPRVGRPQMGGWRAPSHRVVRRPSARPQTAAEATISLSVIDDPVPALSGRTAIGGAWELVESLRPSRVYGQVAGPHRRRPPLPPTFQDARVRLYSLNPSDTADLNRNAGTSHTPRQYVLARSAAGVELACLPVPWISLESGEPTRVEAFIDGTVQPGGFALALSPRDAYVGAALGFMSTGALTAAKDVFDRSRDLLYQKVINPLAAAAGGYCLIGTETGEEAKDWHEWISNLRQLFDWLPDGAILYGQLRMRHRQSDADVAAARDAFFEAYRRGLPFYSLGLQWLTEGLTLLSPREPEAADMLNHVRAVAWLANSRQPFTTLKVTSR